MAVREIAARFDELAQSYYRTWFRFHPEAAVDVGVPGYAHLLTPGPEERRGPLVCLNDELRVALEALDANALDPDRRVDYDVLCGAIQIENQYLLDREPSCPDPRRWLPVNAIYQLTIRTVEDLPRALGTRLDAIPSHLKSAETGLAQRAAYVPPRWATSTITAARRGAEFVRDLPGHPMVATLSMRAALAVSAARAAEALFHFAGFLERDVAPVAKGEFACGSAYFDLLLRRRHFLDVSADALHAFGGRLFERTRAELEAECAVQFGRRDALRVVREIQKRHPAFESLLATYAERMRAAREFVVAKNLVTMPERERLDVVATPAFMRHEIPFAAYSEPASSDPEQHGRYYVTPPINEEQLAEHDEVGLAHTSVHEAYPGHHLQFVTANLNAVARTLPRLLNASASFYEGWALYSEQLMQEQGFLDRPESRIVLLRDRLWRALRVMLDVELHTRGLSFDAAADRMVAALGFPRAQAEADLAWYTRSPTVPLGYAIGWKLINALRDRVAGDDRGAGLRAFHDRL
ncbi:MAG TPA: DUF885 domain-containing protein, partial [Burkholderiales bacterium]